MQSKQVTIEETLRLAEQASLVTRREQLALIAGDCQRIYFGNEFCQNLIPSSSEVIRLIEYCQDKGLGFTLLTPYLTDKGMDSILPILNHVRDRNPGSEVIFNDWGLLKVLTDDYPGLEPVMGRLLHKMKRGPRFMNLKEMVPESTISYYQSSYYQSCSLDSPLYQSFLSEQGIKRVELDNLLQGISLNLKNTVISGSLYVPYAYVTTTRLCLSAGYGEEPNEDIQIAKCSQECRGYYSRLTHPGMGLTLFRKGNTIFFKNSEIPKDIIDKGINRIVKAVDIPI